MPKEELEMKKISRKSLTLVKNIQKGSRITKDCLTLKRPGNGMYYKDINKVLGLRAKEICTKICRFLLKILSLDNVCLYFYGWL